MLNKLERRFGRFAISNLTMYLVIIIAVVSAASILLKVPYIPLSPGVLLTDQWWQVVIFPFRMDDSFLWLFITLYMLWYFGSALEADMGEFRYNLFILVGILASTLAVLFLPYYIPPPWRGYIYISVFLAVAYRSPNTELLLFFILPVKLKWLAWIAIAVMVLAAANVARTVGNAWPFLSPIVSLFNLVLFYGPEIYDNVTRRSASAAARARLRPDEGAIHRCFICGMTERDDPQMDFRYCAECADHEYCRNHLLDHTHMKP